MKTTLSEQISLLHAKLLTSKTRQDIIALSRDFGELVDEAIKKENALPRAGQDETTVSATIKFTKKEVSDMDKTFKKHFILNGYIAHLIKRQSGKRGVLYEIRYRRNGYNIEVSSTDLAEAKRKFLAKTMPGEIEKYRAKGTMHDTIPTRFQDFALLYFNKYRVKEVAEKTYRNDTSRLKTHILPQFGAKDLKRITAEDCQELIDSLMEQNKCKTATEVYNILRCIYRHAIARGIVEKSPLAVLSKPTYDQESGKALSGEEVAKLLTALNGSIFYIPIALALYCGLRPNELSTAEIDGDFIKAVNSKRKKKDKQRIEYKWIPISPQLKPYLEQGLPKIQNLNTLRSALKKVLPDHKLYDCRTTFYSRCKECNIEQAAISAFMGHSINKIDKAYTDLSKAYLHKEGLKFFYNF